MKDWPEDFRILDCYECFTSKGRMCHKFDYSLTFEDTWEMNRAYSICCKNSATEGYCADEMKEGEGNEKKFICSMPSHEPSPDSSKYKDVLSAGNRNY